MSIVSEKIEITGIVGELYYQKNSKHNPTIILLRGGGPGNMEQYVSFSHDCVKAGYTVIRMELEKHKQYAECFLKNFNEYYNPSNWIFAFISRMTVFELTCAYCKAVRATYDNFSSHSAIDNQKMSVVGFSLGAQVALKYARKNSFVKAMVSIMALPDWKPAFDKALQNVLSLKSKCTAAEIEQFLKDPKASETLSACSNLLSPYIRDGLNFEGLLQDFTKYVARVSNENPINGIEGYASNPLLLISGAEDLPDVLQFNQNLFEKLSPLYLQHKENLKIEIENTKHLLTSNSLSQAINFLNKQFQ